MNISLKLSKWFIKQYDDKVDPIRGAHRLEVVAINRGVRYINDSKSTSANAVWFALDSTEGPVIWIAGWDELSNYSMIHDMVKQKVTHIIHLGTCPAEFHKEFGKLVTMIMSVDTMADAVNLCAALAEKGSVLMSPGCDPVLFESVEDRGRRFKHYVNQLP